jgi:predicted TPR repeat methyltransferase
MGANQDANASDEAGWLRTPPTDSAEIASRYNDWAASYESDLVDLWKYQAPVVAANMLAETGLAGPVLDIGCGTGLVGRAAHELGFVDVDGTDLSTASIEVAQLSGNYRNITQHDFNECALPADDNTYSAAICVGVMSYAADPIGLIKEVCRVLRPSGRFVFTHRTDLWDAQNLSEKLQSMLSAGAFASLSWTDPQDYMPGNAEYADLQIRYVSVQKP